MTNPYQHGPSGFPNSNQQAELPGVAPRHFTYSFAVGPHGSMTPYTSAQFARAHPVSYTRFLNPASEASTELANQHNSYQGGSMDGERNGNGYSGDVSRPWTRSQALPSISRAFDLVMEGSVGDSMGSGANNGFFIPSYLKGTTYMHRLLAARKAKIQSQRELQSQAGGTLPSSGGSAKWHNKKMTPASHRGMALDVVEKPPAFEDDTVPPLPSRWNQDDKSGGLEVLADGLEVKYTTPRGQSDREHEACAIRADHYMPPQCGIYYFEVTILSGKRDEYVAATPNMMRLSFLRLTYVAAQQ
jgi:Ran-binding protein 9/10